MDQLPVSIEVLANIYRGLGTRAKMTTEDEETTLLALIDRNLLAETIKKIDGTVIEQAVKSTGFS